MDKIVEAAANELILKYGVLGLCLFFIGIALFLVYKEKNELQKRYEETLKAHTESIKVLQTEHVKQIAELNKAHSEANERSDKQQRDLIEKITQTYTDRLDDMAQSAAREREAGVAGFRYVGEQMQSLQVTLAGMNTLLQTLQNTIQQQNHVR